MNDDLELLRAYAGQGSEAAFETLVKRYVDLVYSAALRQVRQPPLAEEITQTVFIILARKAGSISSQTILPGWLYRTTRYTAAAAVKLQRRREQREQEAHMQTLMHEAQPEPDWEQFSPLLDAAMAQLRERDRDAIILRYFQNKTLRDVGAALGVDEYAAQKRVSRALEKLHRYLAKRGLSSPAAVFAGAMSVHCVQAAPAALAKTISVAALTKGAAASGSTLALVKGALKLMVWTKAKTAVITGATVLLTAAVSTHVWYYHLAPDSWRHRLEAAYRLRHGEVLRYIPPPFISERMTYYRTDNAAQAQAIPAGPSFLLFRQDNQGQLGLPSFGFGPQQFPLWLALRVEFGLKPYEFEGDDHLLNLTVNGDWTLQQDISREALLKALEPILWKVTKHHIVFEKRLVERDVIVVTGDHFTAPQPGTAIQLYAEKSQDRGYDGYGDLKSLFEHVGDKLGICFIDEMKTNAQPPEKQMPNLTWTYHSDCDAIAMKNRRAELTGKVLKNLANQTGLTFTRDQRSIEVWFLTERR